LLFIIDHIFVYSESEISGMNSQENTSKDSEKRQKTYIALKVNSSQILKHWSQNYTVCC